MQTFGELQSNDKLRADTAAVPHRALAPHLKAACRPVDERFQQRESSVRLEPAQRKRLSCPSAIIQVKIVLQDRSRIVDKRTNLIAKIKAQGSPSVDRPLPIVALEDFFAGNEDQGSIGCNLAHHPGLAVFFSTLKNLRDRPEVQDVLVEINEVIEDDPQTWPFSDRVYILSNASTEAVKNWVAGIQPDEVLLGWARGMPVAAPVPRPSVLVYGIWWD